MPDDRTLLSPCGLYCGGCALFQAHIDPELRRKIADARGITEDKLVTCTGCRPQKGIVPSSPTTPCENYVCAVEKAWNFATNAPISPA